MPWEYSQSTGHLRHNGRVIATNGYSGIDQGRNNPAQEMVRDVGPTPRGQYRIAAPRNSAAVGPHAMDLTPVAHNAHGRNAFMIHGDSRENPGRASQGCIILPPNARTQISNSRDAVLNVVR